MRHLMVPVLLCSSCLGDEPPTSPGLGTDTQTRDDVPWSGRLPDLATVKRQWGRRPVRAVFHLHSPFSHDACDGRGYVDGVRDEACLLQLRDALCTTRYDVAFVTDHPSHGAEQPFEALFLDADRLQRDGDDIVAGFVDCDDGHTVQVRAGFEDELMPVGLRRHVHADETTRDELLHGTDLPSQQAMRAAGGAVLIAHTEGRPLAHLQRLQDDGLHGVEAFNVHAMFAPDIREEHLGLDGLGFAQGLQPFTAPDSEAEPDLLFLGVLQDQRVSLDAWDALLARGPMMGTAGTDAHRNVLPLELSDGERVDSFRRSLRWFSTWLPADDTSPQAIDAALQARRAHVVFEALGSPDGIEFHLTAPDGVVFEAGSDASAGSLTVGCPSLHPDAPRSGEPPVVEVSVLRDGEPWKRGCGTWPVGAGVYRVEVHMQPLHLRGFLGAAAHLADQTFPWIYTGAIRVADSP